jgi:hypothetical protein
MGRYRQRALGLDGQNLPGSASVLNGSGRREGWVAAINDILWFFIIVLETLAWYSALTSEV